MPPPCKLAKEEIIQASLNLVREAGIGAVTARALGARLGTSPKPIFTIFENMEEVIAETLKAAKNKYNQLIQVALGQKHPFKNVGTQYILFAKKEPKLFQWLFMTELNKEKDLIGILPLIDENYEKILASIQEEYPVSKPTAEELYRHLWIYTHGIAALTATKVCDFSQEEISRMLTEIFVSLFQEIKKEKTE